MKRQTARRVVRLGAIATAGTLFVASGVWALAALFTPEPRPEAPDFQTTVAREGSVQRAVPVRITAVRSAQAVGRNSASGIVTSIDTAAMSHPANGSVLFTVDLRPISVAIGVVPSFRELGMDDHGPDVRQLQAMLRDAGHLRGALDGRFGPRTASAVRRWHESRGDGSSEEVGLGEVVFVPSLEGALRPRQDTLFVGQDLNPGAVLFDHLPKVPALNVTLSADLSDSAQDGAAIRLVPDVPGWSGSLGRRTPQQDGTSTAEVLVAGSASQCGGQCPFQTLLPVDQARAELIVVPKTQGVTVPTSAVRSEGASTFVRVASGAKRIVEVVAASDGLAVVRGVRSGTLIRVGDG